MTLRKDTWTNFYPVIHKDFRSLPFRDQVRIWSLVLYDEERYKDICANKGYDARTLFEGELGYLAEQMEFMREFNRKSYLELEPSFPVQFVREWAGYNTSYNSRDAEDDELWFGIRHRWLVNVKLFDFPLLVLDKRGILLWDWLMARTKLAAVTCASLFRQFLLMRIIADEMGATMLQLQKGGMRARIAKRASQLRNLRSFDAINEYCPIVLDEETLSPGRRILNGDSRRIPIGRELEIESDCKIGDRHSLGTPITVSQNLTIVDKRFVSRETGHAYLPIIPEYYYTRSDWFSIQNWRFLT